MIGTLLKQVCKESGNARSNGKYIYTRYDDLKLFIAPASRTKMFFFYFLFLFYFFYFFIFFCTGVVVLKS